MGRWIVGLDEKGCATVKYINRHTGVVFDCGTAAKDHGIRSVVDWAISQADPGDVVTVEGGETVAILNQPTDSC